MGPLILAKNFLMVAGPGQVFRSQWAHFDSEFKNATMHIHCQTISPAAPANGYNLRIDSSFDTVESFQTGLNVAVTATGSQSVAVSAHLGPLMRLRIENFERSIAVVAILSVWLQPKST